MSDTTAELKTAEQLARDVQWWVSEEKGGGMAFIYSGTGPSHSGELIAGPMSSKDADDSVREHNQSILRATEPLEKRVRELEAVISEAGITIGADGRVEVDIDDGEKWVNHAFVDAELTRLKYRATWLEAERDKAVAAMKAWITQTLPASEEELQQMVCRKDAELTRLKSELADALKDRRHNPAFLRESWTNQIAKKRQEIAALEEKMRNLP